MINKLCTSIYVSGDLLTVIDENTAEVAVQTPHRFHLASKENVFEWFTEHK